MTRRERILGAVVGAMAVLLIVSYAAWKITDSLAVKNSQITALQKSIEDDRLKAARGRRAADELADFAARALPGNAAQASHMYRTWLLDQMKSLGFENTNLEAAQSRPEGDAYVVHQFRANGHADLEQVTELMYRIEVADILQRVRGFSVTPIPDSRLLDFQLTTEVVSMEDAEDRELPDIPEDKLTGDELAEYKEKILGRNLFGPENNAPRLNVPRTIEVAKGERVQLKAEAEDPDQFDRVSYDADLTEVEGARFDRRSGELSWSPPSTGEYYVTIYADDNGFPRRSDARDVRIVVSDPPPPPRQEDPPPPPKPGLEKALFAEITAITGSGGRKQIWVSIKSEGRTVRVGEGESFQVGEVDATVVTINSRDAEVVAADRVYRVSLGQELVEATVVRDLTEE